MTSWSRSVRFRIGLVAGLCLALGACNGGGGPSGTSLEESVPAQGSDMQALAQTGAMRSDAAIVFLPDEAGMVATVRGHSYVDGFRQDVLLKASPVHGVDNGITILARTSAQSTLDERVPLSKPTEAAIRAEIGRAFPHLSMQVVERPSHNAYGSYGMAIGRAGGTIHCIYMWQWIDADSVGRDVDFTGPASIRVRLCKPDTTFDALAALLDHLSLHRDGGSQSVAFVDPPHETPAPRKRTATRHVHQAQREARADVQTSGFTEAPPAAPAAPQLPAGDLPPQAFAGPTSSATPSK